MDELDFDGATDERESKPRMLRYPVTGIKMNPGDVAAPASTANGMVRTEDAPA